MLGSEILELAIGLVLVFLLVSLTLTATVEAIESVFKTRAADLEHAIKLMLQGGDDGPAAPSLASFYKHPLISALYADAYQTSKAGGILTRPRGGTLPSYIPRDLFSAAVLDLESRDANRSRGPLSALIAPYRKLFGDDVTRIRAGLESWYDGVMDRASGWYKRRTQKLLFWLGLATAVALNMNPLVIGQYLTGTPEARADMVSIAAATVKTGTPSGEWSQVRALDQAVREVGLPIGWTPLTIRRSFPVGSNDPAAWTLAGLMALAGWTVMALAATLGAPFWFDVLNKLMVIRATVKPKEKSGDESSEDRSTKADARTANAARPTAPAAPVRNDPDDDGAVG